MGIHIEQVVSNQGSGDEKKLTGCKPGNLLLVIYYQQSGNGYQKPTKGLDEWTVLIDDDAAVTPTIYSQYGNGDESLAFASGMVAVWRIAKGDETDDPYWFGVDNTHGQILKLEISGFDPENPIESAATAAGYATVASLTTTGVTDVIAFVGGDDDDWDVNETGVPVPTLAEDEHLTDNWLGLYGANDADIPGATSDFGGGNTAWYGRWAGNRPPQKAYVSRDVPAGTVSNSWTPQGTSATEQHCIIAINPGNGGSRKSPIISRWQDARGTSNPASIDLTANHPGPTAGNLLLAFVMDYKGLSGNESTFVETPAGWTEILQQNDSNPAYPLSFYQALAKGASSVSHSSASRCYAAWKVSDGTETVVTFQQKNGASNAGGIYLVQMLELDAAMVDTSDPVRLVGRSTIHCTGSDLRTEYPATERFKGLAGVVDDWMIETPDDADCFGICQIASRESHSSHTSELHTGLGPYWSTHNFSSFQAQGGDDPASTIVECWEVPRTDSEIPLPIRSDLTNSTTARFYANYVWINKPNQTGRKTKFVDYVIPSTEPSADATDFPNPVDLSDMPQSFWDNVTRDNYIPNEMTGWTSVNGNNWTNDLEGHYRATVNFSSGAKNLLRYETGLTDVAFTAEVERTPDQYGGVCVRVTDDDNFLMADITPSNGMRLYERIGGVWNQLDSYSISQSNGVFYPITIRAYGDTVDVIYENSGEVIMSGTTSLLTGTGVGFRSTQTSVEFTNANYKVPFTKGGGNIRVWQKGGDEVPIHVSSFDSQGQTGRLDFLCDLSVLSNNEFEIHLLERDVHVGHNKDDWFGQWRVWKDYEGVYLLNGGSLEDATGTKDATVASGSISAATDGVGGQVGSVISSDGRLEATDSSAYNTGDPDVLTVTTWVKPPADNTVRYVEHDFSFRLEVESDNDVYYRASSGKDARTAQNVVDNEWTYIGGRSEADGWAAMLNGDVTKVSGTESSYNTTTVKIGTTSDEQIMQDVRIAASVLSDDRLASEHSAFTSTGWATITDAQGGGPTNYTLNLEAGTVQVLGQEVTLTYTPNLASYSIDLDAGTVTLTGQDAELTAQRQLELESGSVTVSGEDNNLTVGRKVDLGAGTVTLTGEDVQLLADRQISLEAGQVDIALQTINLSYNQQLNNYEITLDSGTVTISGENITNAYNRAIKLEAGTVTAYGQDLQLLKDSRVDLESGTLTLTGGEVELKRQLAIALEAGQIGLAGAAVTLHANRLIDLEPGSVTLNEGILVLSYGGGAQVVSTLGIEHRDRFGGDGGEGVPGPQGPAGPAGADGADGIDGASAYDIWLSVGNTGTVQDFLDSLVGPQGPAGAQGPQGVQGVAGNDGADGATGATGATGPQGPEGPEGPQGPQGIPGEDGADGGGASVYELVKAKGNIQGVTFDDTENVIAWNAPTVGGTANVSISGSIITINEAGTYKFSVTLRTSNANRTELFIRTYVDGVQDTTEIVSDYVSRDSDQNTGAVSLITGFTLTAAQTIEFRGFGDTDGACTGLDAGTILLIERVA